MPDELDETTLRHIIISRKHTSGNITFCMYLVDLGCLGVKDTLYHYNVPAEILEEFLENMKDDGACFVEIPYDLAHNIIHAGIEYAKDYGFEPCRDYISITSHFLEEDTDDIPFMDIDCGGIYGDPVYINNGMESPTREKQILLQLEKTAGLGNFNIDEDLYGEEEDYTEEEKVEIEKKIKIIDELKLLNLDEKKKLFFELLPKGKKPKEITDDDGIRVLLLCDFIAIEIVNQEELDRHHKHFVDKFDIYYDDVDDLPNSLFEHVPYFDNPKDEDRLIDLFYDTIENINNNDEPKQSVALFRKKVGDVPVTCLLELMLLNIKNSKKYDATLKACLQKYPDYFLFKVNHFIKFLTVGNKNALKEYEDLLLNHGLTITEYEAEFYLFNYGCILGMDENTSLAAILAFESFIKEFDSFSDTLYMRLFTIINMLKMQKVCGYFASFEMNNEISSS